MKSTLLAQLAFSPSPVLLDSKVGKELREITSLFKYQSSVDTCYPVGIHNILGNLAMRTENQDIALSESRINQIARVREYAAEQPSVKRLYSQIETNFCSFMRAVSTILLGAVAIVALSFFFPAVHAQTASTSGGTFGDVGAKYLAAAVAFGLSAAAAGYGIAHAGSAGLAAVAEKPEVRTTALIFVALAEAIAIYGFVIAIIIVGQTA